jgi:hypothetical protein
MEQNEKAKPYKKIIRKFKNKYILALTIFSIYSLFVDDNDIFTIVNYHIRLNKLENQLADKEQKLKSTKSILSKLSTPYQLEKYARENKYFKKDDEDIFVITYK